MFLLETERPRVTALWSLSKIHRPSLVLLMGRKESNQTKQNYNMGQYFCQNVLISGRIFACK